MKTTTLLPSLLALGWAGALTMHAAPASALAGATPTPPHTGPVIVHDITYQGRLSDTEARFMATLNIESTNQVETILPLFQGDIAVSAESHPPLDQVPAALKLPAGNTLPEGLRLLRSGRSYHLAVAQPGKYNLKLEVLAKVTKTDPWRQVNFSGPAATLGKLEARVAGNGVELELLAGTALPRPSGQAAIIEAALGAERRVSLRWQSKTTRQTRAVLMTCQTKATVRLTPAIVRTTTQFTYDILQGKPTNLILSLPSGQSITKVIGANIRDRQEQAANGQRTLTLDFVKPLEKTYTLTLEAEQPLELPDAGATLTPALPAPRGVERERGVIRLSAEDITMQTGEVTGLRQVNAEAGAVAAYQFSGRENLALPLTLKRIEPEIRASSTLTATVEETRLLAIQRITLNVEKAGIYKVNLTPPNGFNVTEVTGPGLMDWEPADGKIQINYNTRVLNKHDITVNLEQSRDAADADVTLLPVRVDGALRENIRIGIHTERGLEARTGNVTGLREIPAQPRLGEALAYKDEAPNWSLTLSIKRLEPTILAEVFNSVTVGEASLRGGAIINLTLLNQGVQKFTIRVPDTNTWKNVKFISPIIRQTSIATNAPGTLDYTIMLEEKTWNDFLMAVSYDNQYEASKRTIALGVPHALEAERQEGALALTIGPSLQLKIEQKASALRLVDETELPEGYRAQLNEQVWRAFQYEFSRDDLADGQNPFDLRVGLTPFDELDPLKAAADRTELTTSISAQGEVLTRAVFHVKNNTQDYLRCTLPPKAEFRGAKVAGQRVKAQVDDGAILIPLPQHANRNQGFSVDIVYSHAPLGAIRRDGLKSLQPVRLKLEAPTIDAPNTYNEWAVYLQEPGHLMFDFKGNMLAVETEDEYSLGIAWQQFLRFYRHRVHWGTIALLMLVLSMGLAIAMGARWRGLRGGLIAAGICVAVGFVFMLIASPAGIGAMTQARMEADGGYGYYAPGDDLGDEEAEIGNTDDPGQAPAEKRDGTETEPPRNTAQPEPSPQTPPATPAPGGEMGGGGGVSQGRGEGATNIPESETLRAAGMLAAETHVPTPGEPYLFTKVLNTNNDKLIIEAQVMDGGARRVRAGIFQVLIALAGLIVLFWELRRKPRNTFWIAAGLAAFLGGVGSMLYTQHALHHLLAFTPFMLGALAYGWLAWLLWPTRKNDPAPPPPPANDGGDNTGAPSAGDSPDTPSAAAPAAAALLLLLGLAGLAHGQQPAPGAGPGTPPLIGPGALELRLVPGGDLTVPGGPRIIRESRLQDRNGTKFEINQDQPYTGHVVGFFDNKQKRVDSPYTDGQLHGVETLWFDNGQRRAQRPWQKGKLHGKLSTWYRNGQRESGTSYQAGQRHGLHRAWHLNGRLAEETTYANGERNGLERHWHADGKIAREVRWENGRQLAFDLWNKEGLRIGAGTNTVSLLHAQYDVTVHAKVATVRARFKLRATKDNQRFTLFETVVPVHEFQPMPANLELRRVGQTLVLILPKAGDASVDLNFLAPHTGDATRRALGFGIPPALTSEVNVVLNEADAEIELPTAIRHEPVAGGDGKTEVRHAIIGANDRVELAWKPRVRKASEIDAIVFANNHALISFGDGVVQMRSVIDFTVSQGELSRARVALPAGWKLMRVESANLRDHVTADEDETAILTADLAKPEAKAWKLALTLERPLPMPPANVPLAIPHPLEVQRENGLLALHTTPELNLNPGQPEGLTKIDAALFQKESGLKVAAPHSVYRFRQAEFTLATTVETVLPRLEAKAEHTLDIGEKQLRLASRITYDIDVKRAGVFDLALRLPEAAWRLDSVTADNLTQWSERTEEGVRYLDLRLKQRTIGQYPVSIIMTRPVDTAPDTATVPAVHPLGVEKLQTFVAVTAVPGLEVSAGDTASLVEIPSRELPQVAVLRVAPDGARAKVLAYKHLDAEPGAQPAWSLTANTIVLSSWLREVQIISRLHITDRLLTGEATVRFNIDRAPNKEFRLFLPKECRNVKITGRDIRDKVPTPRADNSGQDWRIELQNKVLGAYTLRVTWEYAGDLAGSTVPIATPRALGANIDPRVELENGWLLINPRAPLRVEAASSPAGLEHADLSLLPAWARRSDETALLSYQYVRPGWNLTLKTIRHEDAMVPTGNITRARLHSVLAEDGQMMTRMQLTVHSNGKQYLGLQLPGKEPRIWAAFVNDMAVSPARSGDQFRVPLKQLTGDEAMSVRLVYTTRVDALGRRGNIGLEAPQLDLPLQDARWRLTLPEDFDYSEFKGTMTKANGQDQAQNDDQQEQASKSALGPQLGTETVQVDSITTRNPSKRYGQRFYEEQNAANQAYNFKATVQSHKKTRDNLSLGNVADANRLLKQAAQLNKDFEGGRNAGFAQLESDVRRRQALSLLNSKNEFAFRYNGKLKITTDTALPQANNQAPQQQQNPFTTTETKTAEQVVAAFQNAQRVSLSTTVPLQVNLPLAGGAREISFAQSMQLDPDKPMTIEFHAVNTREDDWIDWLQFAGGALALLVGLFVLVTLVQAWIRAARNRAQARAKV